MPSDTSADPIDQQVHLLIESLDAVRDVDDATLRERLVQLERVVNMAQGAQAELMCEIGVRAATADREDSLVRDRHLQPRESRVPFVADEISLTLAITKVAASHRFAQAMAASDHSPLMAAWTRGDIDARKVHVICEELAGCPLEVRESLAEAAASYAQGHTGSELRRWLKRRVIKSEPAAAEVRRQNAMAGRGVTVNPLPNGMSELIALLPSVQARQLYDTVNAIAHAADSDDQRVMDQRRADALVDLVTGRAEPPQVSVQLVVTANTLLGTADDPGHVAGVGPITPFEARSLTDSSTVDRDVVFRRLLVDPVNGRLLDVSEKQYRPSAQLDRAIRARDQVCRFPGCSRPATTRRSGTDLDHTIPWPQGETTASNLAVLCRHHHRLKHSPGWSVELTSDGVMRWTTPTGKTFVTEAWVYADTG